MLLCLQDEFGYNAETQKLLCKNGETLLGAINFFVSSINTLVNKTMEDTLMTIKMYENARYASVVSLIEIRINRKRLFITHIYLYVYQFSLILTLFHLIKT